MAPKLCHTPRVEYEQMFAPLPPTDQIAAGYERVAGVDVDSLTDEQLESELRAVNEIESMAFAHACRVRAAFAKRGVWADAGALSPAAYVAACDRTPTARVKAQFKTAVGLEALPAVLVALEAAAITQWHAELLLKVDNPRTHDALVADQVTLVRWAMTETWRDFCRKVFAWVDQVDPDGPEPTVEKRGASATRDLDGTVRVTASLSRVGGEIFLSEFKRLERLEYQADVEEARKRLGREPNHDELPRTTAQRCHDAMVRMAERSAMLPEDGRRSRPLFLVLVGEQTFGQVCELASGTPLRAGELVPHLDEMAFQTIVFDGPFKAIEASQQRTFRGALRRAGLAIRRTCSHPFCDRPIEECEVDHVVAHSRGGATCQENEDLYCGPHNRMKADLSPEAWAAQLRVPDVWRPYDLDDP